MSPNSPARERRELVARIGSVLRRSAGGGLTVPAEAGHEVRFGTKWLNLEARVLRDEQGLSTRSPRPSSAL